MKSSKKLLQHKKVIFVLFTVWFKWELQLPELAKSSLGVLALEVNQTKIQGLRLEVRAYQYCRELNQVGLWPSWSEFSQENKFTENRICSSWIFNPNWSVTKIKEISSLCVIGIYFVARKENLHEHLINQSDQNKLS